MLIKQISEIFHNCDALVGFWDKLDKNKDCVLAVPGTTRPLMVAASFAANPKTMLVLVAGDDAAKNFAAELRMYLGFDIVLEYVSPDTAGLDAKACAKRNMAMYALCSESQKVIVASSCSIMRALPVCADEFCVPVQFFAGQEYEIDQVAKQLVDAGYMQFEGYDGPGTFCVRGGVIDVWPGQENAPVRLDFFGDELEEIRQIVPSTGQTVHSIDKIDCFPVQNLYISDARVFDAEKRLAPLARTNKIVREQIEKIKTRVSFEGLNFLEPYIFDKMVPISYFLPESSVLVDIESRAILDDMLHFYEDIQAKYAENGFDTSSIFLSPTSLNFDSCQHVSFVSIMQAGIKPDSKLTVKRPEKFKDVEHLFSICKTFIDFGFTLVLSVPNAQARRQIKGQLVEFGAIIEEVLVSSDVELVRHAINVSDIPCAISQSFPDAKLAIISITNIAYSNSTLAMASFASQKRNKFIDVTELTFPYKPGDYVVHSMYGIALFRDIVRREFSGTERDYLLLEYAQKDKLYVPIEQLGRVTKYVGPQGQNPRITRLNTADWSRAIKKARKETKKLAFDLVDVYSRRSMSKGHAFSPDSDGQMQMEADFMHIETEGQIAAIADVKADMESNRPMDRLICGDVGFGKTEVALRAVYKCVDDGYQAMILCPTTILAQQHYQTFYNRLKKYDISVDVLSRFKSGADSKQIIEDFKSDQLDVLIGTHRLLSRDISPKKLGLVVIDEEQRFGVGHKEQLKNFRESIDVLTMSATPIPRTMQMAASGVRDMSLIMTPPDNRKAVKVHVGEWDPDIVSDAIRREMARGGQVYYISNRVQSIKEAAARVGLAAGEARIGIAHGQMGKKQLESVMEEFSAGHFDILVSTTIVESGIDNPNTNTLIIEDSQNLGLAQMYQLKGRVGRSVEQAYAYFLFSDRSLLNDTTVARLTAIDELDELGSGVQIAMRDLEIRGAGNFLGAEQSGNLSGVGFDLFAQMLKGAVENAQGIQTTEDKYKTKYDDVDYSVPSISSVNVNLPGKAYFDDEYIPDVDQRVLWYRRLASATCTEEVYELESQLLEKYPNMPEVAQNLILKYRIAGCAHALGVNLVSVSGGKLALEGIKLKTDSRLALRKYHASYNPGLKRLIVPMRVISSGSIDSVFADVSAFLEFFSL